MQGPSHLMLSWYFAEAARVEEMITEVSRAESEADHLAERLQRRLFSMEEELGVGTVFFLTVFVVLFALMFANLRIGPFAHFKWWPHCAIF